jgi:AraC-like DNA-binding protein
MRCSPPVARSRSDDTLALARGVLAEDSGRSWRLSLLAERIGQSSRTLQRQLLAKGASFSSLLMDVRLAEAARLLTHTSRPLAEIGYACGFADQAHFTRELRRHAALTPLEYRRQFTVMPGPMDDT